MAAAQVAHFRSESKSPVGAVASGVHHNSMATVVPSSSSNNGTNSEGITPLMLACQQGRSEDVQKILRKKASAVKERTRSGKIALHFCSEAGSSSCLDFILAATAVADSSLINAQDEEGYTPLHLAVINGNKDIVRKLIAAGADLNCLDNERHSLVHWSTVCGEVDILELLLSNGAPASTPDIHLAHPIHYAAQMCGSVNGVGSVSRARVQSTVYGVSPKKGLQILKRLIQFGCPIDIRDQDGRQPLLWASSAAGIHLTKRKYEDTKRIHKAYGFVGSGDAILLLVNAGAKVDAEDKDGLTALHCAASRGHTDCLETLIALCGAEVDVIDNNGCTALFYGVTLGHADCTELLLNYGAEPNRQDRKGRTPGHCGAAKGQLETLKLLARHGGNLWLRNVRGDLPLHEAVLSRRKDLVMWLLSQRPDAINTPNNDGKCPIHLAALNNNVEMVKILIDHRADLNLLMRSGKGTPMTPLDAAMHKGNSAVAKFLQLHGGLPSNSLNDAALHRRLNRSIEGQISPAISMHGSLLGHHHPSPEDQHNRTFASPDVFDRSIAQYRHTGIPQAHSTGPFIATSTPIMDDGVQTDPHYSRDMEVQVSDSFEEQHQPKGQRKEEGSTSHRKSERRRQGRRSHSNNKEEKDKATTSDSSPDRSSNQLTSRASRKSSRKSTKGSGSNSHSSARNSEEKDKILKEKVENHDSSIDKGNSEEKTRPGITPQESSDALLDHDNTLMSEKFSELENVAVQSSETDARDEELGPLDDDQNQKPTKTKPKKAEDKKEKSKSPTKADPKSRERKSKSKTPSKDRERSLSAKSSREVKSSGKSESRSRSASAGDSRSSSQSVVRENEKENSSARTPSGKRSSVSWVDKKGNKEVRTRSKSAEERERRSRSKSTGKDAEKSRDRSKSASHNQRSKPKKKDESEKSAVIDKKSKSPVKPGKKVEKKSTSPKSQSVEKTETKVEKRSEKSRSTSPTKSSKNSIKEDVKLKNRKDSDDSGQSEIIDEIEVGKTINLQAAARRRSESLARDPSRSRSRSISQSRHVCDPIVNAKMKKKPVKKPFIPIKPSSIKSKKSKAPPPTTSEEREIVLQEALLASSTKLRPLKEGKSSSSVPRNNNGLKTLPKKSSKQRTTRSNEDAIETLSNSTVIDSGFSDNHRGITTSASDEHQQKMSPNRSSNGRRRVITSRRPISGRTSGKRKTIFSSSPKQYRIPKVNRFDTIIVHQMSIENGGPLEDDISTSTRGGSVTSEDLRESVSPRRRKVNYNRPRSKLTFSRNDNTRDRSSPRPMKSVDVETPISVTQAMQASMRKYNLERTIFHELLELKRLQIRAGKANEQLLVKRMAENYKRAGYSVNFRDYDGPYTFRSFEKYLYDQLRLLQNNRKLLPRFAPSDDIEKLTGQLKKMNSSKLPYLDDIERNESACDTIQCTHTTHKCHHAAHAYTGIPCAAFIPGRSVKKKDGFLPKVNPLQAPGPTQKDLKSRSRVGNLSRNGAMNLSSPMQISITPRTDTQSPITLEVQQGANTQVFTLPQKALDPSKNYYVSLSIKPNPTMTPSSSPVPDNLTHRPSPSDVVEDGSISAPPPPVDANGYVDVDRDKHNRSM